MAFICFAVPAQAGRLEQVKARGALTCGILAGVPGFSTIGTDGRHKGFDVDICRAVAAAILGDPDKVEYVDVKSVARFRRDSRLDMVIRRLTWTLTREAGQGLMFGPIVYHDGQGFMVPKASGIANARQLAGKRICVEPGEGWAGNLTRYSQASHLDFQSVIADQPVSKSAFFGGRCAAYSADKTMLAAIRTTAERPQDYEILPEQVSQEPLAPLLRQGDDGFFQVVRWSVFALIKAEEIGISSSNVEQKLDCSDPDTRRFLGVIPGNGKALGLSERWAVDIVRGVGNYGEIFARNLGAESDVKLERGLNRLWNDGGLLYAPPVR